MPTTPVTVTSLVQKTVTPSGTATDAVATVGDGFNLLSDFFGGPEDPQVAFTLDSVTAGSLPGGIDIIATVDSGAVRATLELRVETGASVATFTATPSGDVYTFNVTTDGAGAPITPATALSSTFVLVDTNVNLDRVDQIIGSYGAVVADYIRIGAARAVLTGVSSGMRIGAARAVLSGLSSGLRVGAARAIIPRVASETPDTTPVTIGDPERVILSPSAPTYSEAEAAEIGAQRLTGLDWRLPRQLQTVSIDGVVYRVRLTYRRRLADWRLDLYAQDGTPIALNRRVTPGWSPNANIRGGMAPVGLLVVPLIENDRRDQLGREITLTFYADRNLRTARDAVFDALLVEIDE